MNNIRILLVDDHVLVRAGLRLLLEKIPWVEVAAEASDGLEAFELIKTHLPHVVLMDISMPQLNGLDAVARITKTFPAVKAIILSMYADENYARQALRVGASGYLLKNAAVAELELAMQAVVNGEIYLSPRISKFVIEGCLEGSEIKRGPGTQLTSRQREIVQLLAEGKTAKEIAFLLNLSAKTIEAHRAESMSRLDIHDLPTLVRYAMRVGLVPPEGQPVLSLERSVKRDKTWQQQKE
jgi:DNA-binding NarL/FixJ family response regulator